MRRLAILLAAVALSAVAAGPAPAADPAPGTASAVVASMLTALNDGRSDDICALFTPELVADASSGQLPCPALIAYLIAGTHDYGPTFDHLDVQQWGTEIHSRAFTGVPIEVTITQKPAGGPPPDPLWTTIWLRPSGTSFAIVKPGGLFAAVNDGASGIDADGAPATADAIDRPAAVPAPRFACRGPVRALRDPGGDEKVTRGRAATRPRVKAPWLDIRRVRVQLEGDRPCITVTLGAPLRPATKLLVHGSYFVGTKGESVGGWSAYLGVDGAGAPLSIGPAGGALGAGAWFGQKGSTITLRLAPSTVLAKLRFQICIASTQGGEPLLPQPLVGNDTVEDARIPQGTDPCFD